MQQWEYLEVFLGYYGGTWSDSVGRQGDLRAGPTDKYGHVWRHSGTLLNDLGSKGGNSWA